MNHDRRTTNQSNQANVYVAHDKSRVYYHTCLAKVNGLTVRVLYDGASGSSFITSKLAKSLRLKIDSAKPMAISVFASNQIFINNEATTIQVNSIANDFNVKLRVRVVDDFGKACFAAMPPTMMSQLKERGIEMHDDEVPIDLLIGVGHHRKFHDGPEIEVLDDFLGKRTKLGWIVYGGNSDDATETTVNVVKTYDDEVLHELMHSDVDGSHEKIIDEFVRKSVTFTGERYQVALPWIEPVELKSNFNMCKNRLMRYVQKLKDQGKFTKYESKLMEFMELNFAERVSQRNQVPTRTNYLPHHGVDRDDKETMYHA